MKEKLVSIIVRSKNEENWIGDCLYAIRNQTYKNIEIILVDNMSTDKTVAKALEYDVTLVEIEKFLPGLAINDGIKASNGEFIVCLSAHCIPTDEMWLENLISPLDDHKIAGVYGRQLPMNFTSALDKRDLAIVFGLDSRTQVKDGFFHNANSIFRRSDWDIVPFDEEATNIEDRLWGNEMISRGRQIYYEPAAAVFHHHGIHQGLSEKRAQSIIKIIEKNEGVESQGILSPKDRHIISIIPFSGKKSDLNIYLLERTIKNMLSNEFISKVVLGLIDEDLVKFFDGYNDNLIVFKRDKRLEEDSGASLATICAALLDEYEKESNVVDSVVIAFPKNTFRTKDLINNVLSELYLGGYDSVFPAVREKRDILNVNDEIVTKIPEKFDLPRSNKNKYILTAVNGLGLAIRANYLRQGFFKSLNSAAHVVEFQMSAVEVQSSKFSMSDVKNLTNWFDSKEQ